MSAYSPKKNKNEGQSASNDDLKKKNVPEPGFKFTDNRPESLTQKKMQESADKSQKTKQLTQLNSANPNAKVYQRIAWHEKAHGSANALNTPNINGVNDTGGTTSLSVAGYPFTGPLYAMDESTGAEDKTALITDIASKIGSVTYPENDTFLTKKQLETTLGINNTIPHGNINTAIVNGNHRTIYRGALDPFIVRAPGKTKDNEKIALHYQFGKDSYGYIVKIEQDGKEYTMHAGRGQKELVEEQKKELAKSTEDQPLFNQFSSAHDTETPDENISEVASKSTTDKDLKLYPRSKKQDRVKEVSKLEEISKRLDAVTKIGGEGARWQCVREQAGNKTLTNETRFYTINHHNGNQGYVGITFKTLWGMWASEFDSKFNITNATVIQKLLELYDSDDTRIINIQEDEDLKDDDYSLN